jgi:hypothetical protein
VRCPGKLICREFPVTSRCKKSVIHHARLRDGDQAIHASFFVILNGGEVKLLPKQPVLSFTVPTVKPDSVNVAH